MTGESAPAGRWTGGSLSRELSCRPVARPRSPSQPRPDGLASLGEALAGRTCRPTKYLARPLRSTIVMLQPLPTAGAGTHGVGEERSRHRLL